MKITDFNYDRVEDAINYLVTNFKKQPDLNEVSDHVHVSAQHFQRIFTDFAGVSPKKFMQYLSVDYLRSHIFETKNLEEAADLVGLSTTSRVYDLFVTLEAVTPNEYKTKGSGLDITFGVTQSPFGDCLIGITPRGLCHLSFVDPISFSRELSSFQNKFNSAEMEHNDTVIKKYAEKIFGSPREKLNVLVSGTNFQIKVWEALLRIPEGKVSTYSNIAEQIKNPKAVRAVGSAVGENPIAYLIPCHRVIRKEGVVGEYHWGSTRKRVLLGYEMSKSERMSVEIRKAFSVRLKRPCN